LHRGRVGDDVLVGEDVAVRVIDHARALTLGGPALAAEEPEAGALALRDHPDVYDARTGGLVDLVDAQPGAALERGRLCRIRAPLLNDGRRHGSAAVRGGRAGDDQRDHPSRNGAADDRKPSAHTSHGLGSLLDGASLFVVPYRTTYP